MQGTPSTSGSVVHLFPRTPEAGAWHHVAGVLDSRGMLLYMDGQLPGRNAEPFRMGSACPLIIGANDNEPQRHFNGLIDEVMVFRRALSAEEIADLYRAGL